MEFFPSILTEEESISMISRIKIFFAEHHFGLWAAELKQTKEFIGFTGLSVPRFQTDFTPCVEVGWRLAYKHWGHGYAPEAAIACFDYGFNILKLKEIMSFTSILNTRSISVMKKTGMNFIKNFEHPCIEEGNRLKTHALFVKESEKQ